MLVAHICQPIFAHYCLTLIVSDIRALVRLVINGCLSWHDAWISTAHCFLYRFRWLEQWYIPCVNSRCMMHIVYFLQLCAFKFASRVHWLRQFKYWGHFGHLSLPEEWCCGSWSLLERSNGSLSVKDFLLFLFLPRSNSAICLTSLSDLHCLQTPCRLQYNRTSTCLDLIRAFPFIIQSFIWLM